RDVYARLEGLCETLALPRGLVLHKAGDVIRDLYFPIDCMISITVTMRQGKTAETGVIGNREVAGNNAFMGERETTQTEYETQIPGTAVCVPAKELKREFDQNSAVRVLLKFTQAMIAQISQNTRLQPAPFGAAEIRALAPRGAGSHSIGRAATDAGVRGRHARRPPRERDERRTRSGEERLDHAAAGAPTTSLTVPVSKRSPANATPSSKRNTIAFWAFRNGDA
ncbi:MAG: Crp/Fnr family transcriptional regulator, partial [Thermoanaerobaculia bacterium]